MKKPIVLSEDAPRIIRRADRAPTEGFALVVDSRMKAEYTDEEAATKAAEELKARYPMLQVQVYDAATRVRTLIGE